MLIDKGYYDIIIRYADSATGGQEDKTYDAIVQNMIGKKEIRERLGLVTNLNLGFANYPNATAINQASELEFWFVGSKVCAEKCIVKAKLEKPLENFTVTNSTGSEIYRESFFFWPHLSGAHCLPVSSKNGSPACSQPGIFYLLQYLQYQ